MRRKLSARLCLRVLREGRYRCAECGASPSTEEGIVLHIDHLLPVCEGGTNCRENLRVLCSVCNETRGSKLAGRRWREGILWALGIEPGRVFRARMERLCADVAVLTRWGMRNRSPGQGILS